MQLSEYIKNGETSEQFLGAEIEHFILDENNKSVFYSYEDNKPGVQDIIEELSPNYNEKIFENFNGEQYLIGLRRDGCDITIEPGAQFEVSIKKCKTVQEIENIYNKFLEEVKVVLNKHKYYLAHIGYRPDCCALEVPIIPKLRYICMDANFKNVGTQGFCMMRCSAATQLTIDYSSEEDCKKKMKVATAISPLIYFLLDNSPIFERCKVGNEGLSPSGIPIAKRMARWQIWNNADADRCASVPEIFDDDFSYEKYADVIKALPEVYMPKNFENDEEKIKHELSMCFYDARLKNKIEIRPADSMPKDFTMAYIELLQNIFYNSEALDKLWDKYKNLTFEDYKNAGKELQEKGWNANVYGQNIYDAWLDLLDLAKTKPCNYLSPIEKLVENKSCLLDGIKNDYPEIEGSFSPVSKTETWTQIQANAFKDCKQDLEDHLKFRENSKVSYEGKVSRTGYFAKFFDINNQVQFKLLTQKTCNILKKIYDEYYKNSQFKSLFKWDEYSSKLINFKPKYAADFPVARFDIFFNDAIGQFEFCELNTGGSAAMNKVTGTCEEIKNTLPYKKVIGETKGKTNFNSADVYTPWVKEFEKIYLEWVKNTKHESKKINVAIVDLLDNCQIEDFPPFKETFIQNGMNCEICDLRDLRFDGKNLTNKDGYKINAVYKRITLDDLIPFKDSEGAQAFVEAVFNDKVCPIDWFNSQLVHDKQLFAILHEPETQKLLNESEKDFVKLHVPETHILSNNIKNIKKFIDNKDDYLIKPINSRDAKNVFIGKEMNEKDWEATLKKCLEIDGFVIQKFATMQTSANICVDIYNKNDTLTSSIQQCCNMEGLYCYNSHFSGTYLRQRRLDKDASDFDMAVPVFYEEYKN